MDPEFWQSRAGRRLLGDAGGYARNIRGILNGLDHFANGDAHVIVRSPPDAPVETFYDVLSEFRDRNDLEPLRRQQIESTMQWIHSNIEHSEWAFRSAVITHMGGAPQTTKQQTIWNTVIQAYNCAVESTIDPQAGSTGMLPHSPPIGVYRHTPYNGLLVIDKQPGKPFQAVSSLRSHIRAVSWDPLEMNWTRLRDIATATSDERAALQNTPAGAEGTEVLENLITGITSNIKWQPSKVSGLSAGFVTVATAGGGAALAVLLGGDPTAAFGLGLQELPRALGGQLQFKDSLHGQGAGE